MSFSDMFKKSFLEGYTGNVSTVDILVTIGVASALAMYVFFVYRVMTRKTFYSKTFNISLAALAVITTSIILAVQSNIVISLGMVGALSIVRFRTAIKEPLDLTFLFWSISIGIICGAGLAMIAVILSLILTTGIFILDRMPIGKVPLMLVVNATDVDRYDEIINVIKEYCKNYKIKSHSYSDNCLNLVVEVRISDDRGCIKRITQLSDITSVSLISHDGEVTY